MNTAWQLEILDDAIALLTIDLPEKPVNTLGRETTSEVSWYAAANRDSTSPAPTCTNWACWSMPATS